MKSLETPSGRAPVRRRLGSATALRAAPRSVRAGAALVALALASAAAGCVPEGPGTADGGAAPPPPKTVPLATARPPAGDAAADGAAQAAPSGPPITAPFEDDFNRAEPGPDWNVLSPKWKITGGRLCARGARNRGAWLVRKLPVNARIEFDAISETHEGDLKVELWGDGASGATGQSYTNATSYLAILGGWKNSKHVLARLDEHGADRQEIDVEPGSDDERARPVEAGQPYHFKVERGDGRTIDWSVNGVTYFKWSDPDPLAGAGHEHVGFNDWDAPVCFDNLKVTPL